jgi:hypothetical protein
MTGCIYIMKILRQYGKFWRLQKCTWYIEDKKEAEDLASKLGFTKVSEEKEL